jgi:hypothetical protein
MESNARVPGHIRCVQATIEFRVYNEEDAMAFQRELDALKERHRAGEFIIPDLLSLNKRIQESRKDTFYDPDYVVQREADAVDRKEWYVNLGSHVTENSDTSPR